MSIQERVTYEQNASFIRESVERLERGDVSIDELEALATQMSAAFKVCRERLAKTRQMVSETMQQQTQADS